VKFDLSEYMRPPATILMISVLALSPLCSASENKPAVATSTFRITPCAEIRAPGEIRLPGKTLHDMPDIKAEEIRRASNLYSSGCSSDALALLEAYRLTNPLDDQVFWLDGRIAGMSGDRERADSIFKWLLSTTPNFTSAKILLAYNAFMANRIDDAQLLLDEIEHESPNDLWLFMIRLAISAKNSPDQKVVNQYMEIIRNSSFPPAARSEAAYYISRLSADTREWEESRRIGLTYDSRVPLWAKAVNLARWLEEWQLSPNRGTTYRDDLPNHDEARELLKQFSMDSSEGRTQLALSYLLEAAEIAAMPTSANMMLVVQARDALNDDLSPVANRVVGRPYLYHIRPFLVEDTDPNEKDQYGRTALCNAILYYDMDAFWNELNRGADLDQKCGRYNLVDSVLAKVTVEHVAERQTLLRELLSRGVRPMTGYCRDAGTSPCTGSLGPILEEFE